MIKSRQASVISTRLLPSGFLRFSKHLLATNMVTVVQLVRASDCGSECRGFESHQSPQQNLGNQTIIKVFLFRNDIPVYTNIPHLPVRKKACTFLAVGSQNMN